MTGTITWPTCRRRLASRAEALAHSVAPDVATGALCVVRRCDLPEEY